MNQFIKKVLIFSSPALIFVIFIEILLRNIPNDYSYKKKHLDTHSNEIETLFLGNSHTYRAINPVIIHSKGFNASYVSQSLDYDIEIFEKYENQMFKLKHIVVPIDYFSLYNRLETGIESWRVKNYIIYYGFNRSYKIKDNFEILNGKLSDNFKRLIKFYLHNKSDRTCNNYGWGKREQTAIGMDLNETGKSAAKRHYKKSKSFFNQNVAIVNRIISFAKAKNAKVIFYTSPAYKTYTSQLNKEQLQTTITTIQAIQKVNTHVSYFNFLNDTTFSEQDFYDADHLNEKGAEKFSKKIDSILISLKQQ